MTENSATSSDIEVGELASDGLRYWTAKLAVEHSERRLDMQNTNMDGFIARATQILGWNIALMAAFLAFAQKQDMSVLVVVIMTCGMFTTGFCAQVLRPREFYYSGEDVGYLLHEQQYTSELLLLEHIAAANQGRIAHNNTSMEKSARYIRRAWLSFSATPLAGMAAYLFTSSLLAHHLASVFLRKVGELLLQVV